MTQIQALGLVVAFVMALSLILTIALFITALAYEARAAIARRRSRRLRANVGSYTIRMPAPEPPDAGDLADFYARQRVGITGRWSA